MTVPVEVQKSQIAILVEVLIQEVQAQIQMAQIHLITEVVAISSDSGDSSSSDGTDSQAVDGE